MTDSNSKTQEALDLLQQAAKEKRDEIQNLIAGKYSDLRELFTTEGFGAAETVIREAKDAGTRYQKELRKMAQELDENVHHDPWKAVGIATLGALLLGYLLGRKR